MKIFLLSSPRYKEVIQNPNPKYVLNDFIKYPPLALLSIVRNIPSEHEVTVFDSSQSSFNEITEIIIKAAPDIVGISCVTERFYAVLLLSKIIKKNLPSTIIVLGGGPMQNYIHWKQWLTLNSITYLRAPANWHFPIS